MSTFIIFIIAAIGIAAAVYFINKSKATVTTSSVAPVPTTGGWVQQYGRVTVGPEGNFSFGEPHYIVRASTPLHVGQTITMRYRVECNGYLYSVQDGGPAFVTLFLQRGGDNLGGVGPYQQYRYFGGSQVLAPGDGSISLPLNGENWGDVYGERGSQHPDEFAACLANISVVGFVFGNPGAGATGHGAAVRNGTATFTVLEYSIS